MQPTTATMILTSMAQKTTMMTLTTAAHRQQRWVRPFDMRGGHTPGHDPTPHAGPTQPATHTHPPPVHEQWTLEPGNPSSAQVKGTRASPPPSTIFSYPLTLFHSPQPLSASFAEPVPSSFLPLRILFLILPGADVKVSSWYYSWILIIVVAVRLADVTWDKAIKGPSFNQLPDIYTCLTRGPWLNHLRDPTDLFLQVRWVWGVPGVR